MGKGEGYEMTFCFVLLCLRCLRCLRCYAVLCCSTLCQSNAMMQMLDTKNS